MAPEREKIRRVECDSCYYGTQGCHKHRGTKKDVEHVLCNHRTQSLHKLHEDEVEEDFKCDICDLVFIHESDLIQVC